MNPSPRRAALAVAVFLAPPTAALAQTQAPDPDAIAARIVSDAARVVEGDVVLIRGNSRDQELLEDIAIRCRAAGAFPLLQYTSDHLAQGLVDQVEPRFDNQLSALDARLAAFVTCVVEIDASDNPGLLNHIAPQRLAQLAKSDAAAADLFRRAGVRTVLVGNGLYPTAPNANQYAISQTELARIFWAAASVPASQLSAIGDLAALPFTSGKEVRITNPNGTDLKLKIDARRVSVSDGTISDDDVHAGRGIQVRLPAGEVLIGPVPGTAEGRVVVDSLTYRGREVLGLTAVFKAGRVVNLYAKSGGDAVRPIYDASGPGKEQLAYVDLGVNPDVPDPAGTKLNAPMPRGMVTVYIGNNTRIGGEDTSPFELPLYLPGSTLAIDGQALVTAGRLVLPTSPLPKDEATGDAADGAAAPSGEQEHWAPNQFGPEPLHPEKARTGGGD